MSYLESIEVNEGQIYLHKWLTDGLLCYERERGDEWGFSTKEKWTEKGQVENCETLQASRFVRDEILSYAPIP